MSNNSLKEVVVKVEQQRRVVVPGESEVPPRQYCSIGVPLACRGSACRRAEGKQEKGHEKEGAAIWKLSRRGFAVAICHPSFSNLTGAKSP